MRDYFTFLRYNWPLLGFGFSCIFWGNLGQSFFVSWYGASIQGALNLSAAAYGSLYSGGTLASALTIIALGGLIDRWPLARFTIAVAGGLTAACILMLISNHAFVLLGAFYLLRLCGQGLLPHTAQTTMARYFDADRGKALSVSASAVPIGEVVLPLLAVALISSIGWRGSWFVFALSIPLLYLPISLWLLRRSPQLQHDLPPQSAHTKAKAKGRRDMLGDYRFWLALPTVLAPPFLLTAIFIQQGFILQEKNWDPIWLASCFIVFGAMHWLASLLAGVLIDQFSARKLLPFILAPLILALLSLAYLDGYWVAPLFMGLLGVTIGTSSPVNGALWAEVYGTTKLGSIRSLMTALMVLSTAASPILFGAIIDMGASAQTLFSVSALCVLAAAGLVMLSYPRQP
ncbi:MFS transporter [Gilvimarinus agarilyticus]|uniref:MFS transporter n=1 Tax=Gilvimarinus sp. 2_MG-2023 TaxID=3062666 RepID=UPI001C087F22|nr:MFS transporter [Gilvimarinus sp. 2_MG-2023]MBU2885035.1 MFS transporter [Gilvimarinus agarilyticus]MDO6569932.1 MFS transporter [Gilvimarinus sp. 2_MG-2023]